MVFVGVLMEMDGNGLVSFGCRIRILIPSHQPKTLENESFAGKGG